MEISKGARRGTHLNGLEIYYVCCRVKENKQIQLHLQWIQPQKIIVQSYMHMCQSQNTQLKQKHLKLKMACTKKLGSYCTSTTQHPVLTTTIQKTQNSILTSKNQYTERE